MDTASTAPWERETKYLEGGLGFQVALALEVPPEQFDRLVGEAREVGQGLLLHAPPCVAVGAAKELGVVGLVALPAGDDGDIDAHAGLYLVPTLLRSSACRTYDHI